MNWCRSLTCCENVPLKQGHAKRESYIQYVWISYPLFSVQTNREKSVLILLHHLKVWSSASFAFGLEHPLGKGDDLSIIRNNPVCKLVPKHLIVFII
jgi:hypothetical protein